MIGLALACTMSIIGASAKASVDQTIDENFIGNYVVGSAFGQPFSPQVADRIDRVRGVTEVVRQRYAFVEADGKRTALTGVVPSQLSAFGLDARAGHRRPHRAHGAGQRALCPRPRPRGRR